MTAIPSPAPVPKSWTFEGVVRLTRIGSTYVNEWTVRGSEIWKEKWTAWKVHDDESTRDLYYDAKNGVLTLKGNVKTTQQKAEAEQLASKIPNVQQVVNQIDVNR